MNSDIFFTIVFSMFVYRFYELGYTFDEPAPNETTTTLLDSDGLYHKIDTNLVSFFEFLSERHENKGLEKVLEQVCIDALVNLGCGVDCKQVDTKDKEYRITLAKGIVEPMYVIGIEDFLKATFLVVQQFGGNDEEH